MNNINNIEVITLATYIFFIYLVMAILVERVLEFLMSVYNYYEFKFAWYDKFWNAKARALQQRFDRLYNFQGASPGRTEQIFNWVLWKVISDRPYEGGREVVSADLVKLNYVRIITRVFAFFLSFVLVLILKLDMIDIIYNAIPEAKILSFVTDVKIIRYILSAAAISIGTEPLHHFISRIEKIEKRSTTQTVQGV